MRSSDEQSNFIILDLVRGLLALFVAAGHLRACTLTNYAKITNPNFFQSVFYFFTSLGHEAVIGFFCLSGFFVGGSVLKKGSDFKLGEYMIARLSRLWVPLIPSLFVVLIISRFIGQHYPEVLTGRYFEFWHMGPILDGGYSHSVFTMFGNILFLQGTLVSNFGVNSSLWTLSYEFWFYVTFPLLFIAAGGRQKVDSSGNKMFSGLITVVIGFFLLRGKTVEFLVWLMGVLVFWLSRKLNLPRNRISFSLSVLVLLGILVISKTKSLIDTLFINYELILGFGFSLVVWSGSGVSITNKSWSGRILRKIASHFSGLSYTLYLNHLPFIILLASICYRAAKSQPNLIGITEYFIQLVVIWGISYVFWFCFERNTKKVRENAMRMWSRSIGK